MNTNAKRLFKAILSQAMVDALYIPNEEDKKIEKEFYKKELNFKNRSSTKQYKRKPPKRLQNEMAFKRDALEWLYGHNKKDLWILDLCCDVCEISQSRIKQIIEINHKTDKYNLMCKTNFNFNELIKFK